MLGHLRKEDGRVRKHMWEENKRGSVPSVLAVIHDNVHASLKTCH